MRKKNKMTEIIPAVLAESYEELYRDISKVVSLSHLIQIDVCDGKFVESRTWPMNAKDESSVTRIIEEEEGMPYWDTLDFEFDLMIKNGHKQFDFFSRLGAKRIVFHLEAEDEKEFKEFLEALDPYYRENIEIGLALNTTTPIEKIAPYINYVNFVQCMGIEHIGFQGEPFDIRVIDQIKLLKEKYPELTISVDGCVNEETAPLLVSAGADRLVVGSALTRSIDVRATMKELGSL